MSVLLDLQGREAPSGWTTTTGGLLVPADMVPRYAQPVGVDLFAGCGGFSCGFHQAGIHVAAAVEYDFAAATTYLVNLARPGVKLHFDTPEREAQYTAYLERHLGVTGKPDGRYAGAGMLAGDGWIKNRPAHERGCEHFWIADARNLTGAEILAALGLKRGEVTVVCGGPPCQGYSVAGKQDVMDPRNSLVFEFARLCLEIWPKTFVMENVPNIASMLTPEGVPVIDALCRVMEDGGFSEYSALKKALESQAGAAAGMRRDKAAPKGRRKAAEPGPEPTASVMEALF